MQAAFEDHNNRNYTLNTEESSSLMLFSSDSPGPIPKAIGGRFTAPKYANEAWDNYMKNSAIEKKDMRLKENQELHKELPATSKKAPKKKKETAFTEED